jgi:hypothetical protein
VTCRQDILIFFGEGEAAGFVEGKNEDARFRRLDDGCLRKGFYGD